VRKLRFVKMHGSGNDYIYVDCFEQEVTSAAALARALSPRRTAVGSDGLILILPSDRADCRMKIYNADGSRGEMCGNGIRCVGKYLYENHRLGRTHLTVDTDCGIKELELKVSDGLVREVTVDMGAPQFEGSRIPLAQREAMIEATLEVNGREFVVTCLSMGNPHCVVFVDKLDAIDLPSLGPLFEHHPMFPERINTEFVVAADRSSIRLRVWERGSGETLACGTGACAAVVAGATTGRIDRKSSVDLRGGRLMVNWSDDDHVYMTGPAVEVFRGEVDLEEVLSCSRA